MTTNLQDITWQSLDDVLEARNEDGHLKANILFTEDTPTIGDMDGFQRVLCFMKGKTVVGGSVNRTEVFLNEENGYSEVHPSGKISGKTAGEYEVIGLDIAMVNYSLGEDTITIKKSPSLSAAASGAGGN